MVVDLNARKKLADEMRHKELLSAVLKSKETPVTNPVNSKDEGIKLVGKFEMDEKFLDYFDKKNQSEKFTLEFFNKLARGLVTIYNAIKGIKVTFPKSYFVHGSVDVSRIEKVPPIEINNFRELKSSFDAVENRIAMLATAISMVPSKSEKTSKEKEIKIDFSGVEKLLDKINSGISQLGKKEVNIPRTVEVSNFPPQMTPTPVTHLSINALNGFVHTTAATVTTTLTTLPTYGVLSSRRAIIIYNNSTQTVYIGGSGVTTANGLPVPKATYSPPLDLGKTTILYGVVAAGSADVRCLEVSDEESGR